MSKESWCEALEDVIAARYPDIDNIGDLTLIQRTMCEFAADALDAEREGALIDEAVMRDEARRCQ